MNDRDTPTRRPWLPTLALAFTLTLGLAACEPTGDVEQLQQNIDRAQEGLNLLQDPAEAVRQGVQEGTDLLRQEADRAVDGVLDEAQRSVDGILGGPER